MPNGSYQGAHTTASAERSSAGTSARGDRRRGTAPGPRRRQRAASACSRASVGIAGCPRRRAADDAARRPAPAASAATDLVDALAPHQPADAHQPRPPARAAATGPSGENARVSTPQGTTRHAAAVGAPCGSARTPRRRRSRGRGRRGGRAPARRAIRPAGWCRRAPWWRRLTLPSAWKVWTTGCPGRASAAVAASPDIQKWACTTSGGSARQARSSPSASAGMCGRSSSFGIGRAGPASTWRDDRRRGAAARARAGRGRRGGCSTVTSWPAAASARLSSPTCTFCPPASTPPRAASGLACSETIAMRTGQLLLECSTARRAARCGGTGRRSTARSSTASQSARNRASAEARQRGRAGGPPAPRSPRRGRRRASAGRRAAAPGRWRAPRPRAARPRPPRSSPARRPACPAASPRSATARARSSARVHVGARGGRARRACGAGAGRRRRGRGRSPRCSVRPSTPMPKTSSGAASANRAAGRCR